MNRNNRFFQTTLLAGLISFMCVSRTLAVNVNHWVSGEVGSVKTNFVYENARPHGDTIVSGWDLITPPDVPITGPWGEKTGLFAPAPYKKYGLARKASQPTTYVQIVGSQVGICLDVQPDEIPLQTYNPNVKLSYTWEKGDYYPGPTDKKTWLYPFHEAYPSPDPRLQCSFQAAIKTSTGTGARHSNIAFNWWDEQSSTTLYVQYCIYDCRGQATKPVKSGIDTKIKKLWISQKVGADEAFHSIFPNSAVFSGDTRSDYARFGIDQSWSQFVEMIGFLNLKYDLKLGTDRNKWRLTRVMFNLEMQRGHAGSLAGKVKDIVVRTHY